MCVFIQLLDMNALNVISVHTYYIGGYLKCLGH